MWFYLLIILILCISLYYYFNYNKQKNEKFINKTKLINVEPEKILQNDKVYLKMKYGDNINEGIIKIELFSRIVPKTCNNFLQLCKDGMYVDTPFHRVVKGFCIQGGDITNGDGTGSMSIYGGKFKDENFKINHSQFCVSMANSGKDTNGSQFFITTEQTPHLNGKHVVFGKVIEGFKFIKEIENLDVDTKNSPFEPVRITECGIINE